jgi:acyl-homoserine-lactone acylase
MTFKTTTTLLCLCFPIFLFAQNINPENIEIVRDKWGVPHIFAPTDEEAAYGIAWAHCEDNFKELQEPLLTVRGLLGQIKGKEGVIADAACFLLDAQGIAAEKYETTFSPKFKKILEAYAAAVNRYAELHPKEVLHRKLFPAKPQDIVAGYILTTAFISNFQYDVGRIFENDVVTVLQNSGQISAGSNGFAFNELKTKDGKTYMVSNSHQPLQGYTAWYELHVCSEEGWNFHGASFAGGVTPFVGTNEHLGWTHTVNYNDNQDVYQLLMHPKKKLQYRFDGEWLQLEKRIFKAKVKVGIFKIPIKKIFYWSKHGPVIKNKQGFFALRLPAIMHIGSAEQWYRMNKAQNKEEFLEAMRMQEHPSLATVYADKEGNISFYDNGLFPKKDPAFNWKSTLRGDTSANLWAAEFAPFDEILQVHNPDCGYLYHANGSGLYCTGKSCKPIPDKYLKMGYQPLEVARNRRVTDLMMNYDKVSYQDIKDIKYDQNYSLPLYTRTIQNLDDILNLSAEEYPKIAEALKHIEGWDGSATVDNRQAAVLSLAVQEVLEYMMKENRADISGNVPKEVFVRGLKKAQKHLKRHFGTLDIPLGDLQKHVRGDRAEPIGGMPEVLAALYTKKYKKKYRQSFLGDSFIMFVTYNKDGVEKIESVNCYGASNRPESPHYDDQMSMYVNQELKSMSLKKEEILKDAEKSYHPK